MVVGMCDVPVGSDVANVAAFIQDHRAVTEGAIELACLCFVGQCQRGNARHIIQRKPLPGIAVADSLVFSEPPQPWTEREAMPATAKVECHYAERVVVEKYWVAVGVVPGA